MLSRAETSASVSILISKRPSPSVWTLPLSSESWDTDNFKPEFTITSPTFMKSAAFVWISNVPSSMMRFPKPRSIELPSAKTSVSASSWRSNVKLPPSRSTFTRRMMLSEPSVVLSIIIRTSPLPLIVLVALTTATWEEVSSSSAPACTSNVTPDKSAPCWKETLSVSTPLTPDTVIAAEPRSAVAKNVTPPVVSMVAVMLDIAKPLRSTSVAASMLLITTLPVPVPDNPEITSASAVSVTVSTRTSSISAATILTAEPDSGVKIMSASTFVTTIFPLSLPTTHCLEPVMPSVTSKGFLTVTLPPPQAEMGRRSNGNNLFLFFLAILLAHLAINLARASGVAGSSRTSTASPTEAK